MRPIAGELGEVALQTFLPVIDGHRQSLDPLTLRGHQGSAGLANQRFDIFAFPELELGPPLGSRQYPAFDRELCYVLRRKERGEIRLSLACSQQFGGVVSELASSLNPKASSAARVERIRQLGPSP